MSEQQSENLARVRERSNRVSEEALKRMISGEKKDPITHVVRVKPAGPKETRHAPLPPIPSRG